MAKCPTNLATSLYTNNKNSANQRINTPPTPIESVTTYKLLTQQPWVHNTFSTPGTEDGDFLTKMLSKKYQKNQQILLSLQTLTKDQDISLLQTKKKQSKKKTCVHQNKDSSTRQKRTKKRARRKTNNSKNKSSHSNSQNNSESKNSSNSYYNKSSKRKQVST